MNDNKNDPDNDIGYRVVIAHGQRKISNYKRYGPGEI